MTTATKTLKRIKLSKLDGTVASGDCPEGEVLLDGVVIGTWQPDAQDEALGFGREYRVFGYSATLDDWNGREQIDLGIVRVGATESNSSGWGRPYNLSNVTETGAAAKARLRRMIAATVETLETTDTRKVI